MHPFFLLTTLLPPFTLTTALTPTPLQSLALATLDLIPLSPTTNTNTNLSAPIGCFNPTKTPPFLSTNKPDCETALDTWVRGQSLIQIRTFGRNPSVSTSNTTTNTTKNSNNNDIVLLPIERVSGSCSVYVNVVGEEDEDEMTLAEVYAELLGPDGVMKNCLGQRRAPAIGGRMTVGRRGVVRVVVTGVGAGV